MASFNIPQLPLTSGVKKIPVFGMGTSSHPPVAPEKFREAIFDAIKMGYRHFDTASLYHTEQPLGEAIAEAISLGLIKSRNELFITTKLWPSDAHSDRVKPALEKSLKTLQLEYVDLYLIHWPISLKPLVKIEMSIKKEDLLPMDFKGVWESMEECQRLGLTKSIGVSNFSCKKLSDLLLFAKIPPVVNQVEMHPVWQQKKLIEFCKAKQILVAAYSPLGAKGTPWGTNSVMDSEVLKQIAEAKGKTLAQVCLRWAYEQGVVVVVKSFNKDRMKENLEIFDWELSEEDSKKIREIPQTKTVDGDFFVSENGPFKSPEELWDGEI